MILKPIQKYFITFFVPTTLLTISVVFAGNPGGAYYSQDNTNIFWIALLSDTHIGNPWTPDDNDHLNRFLSGREIISSTFIVTTGDLTDHLRCNPLTGGWPCDHPGEWDEYRQIVVVSSGMDIDSYSDAPGNHDQYWEDVPLTLYLAYSVQGVSTNQTQRSWVYTSDFGKYHFITIATPHPDYADAIDDGRADSPGELNETERNFIETELIGHNDSNLTFVFGHHPIANLIVGRADFISLLQNYGVSLYGYGHTHNYNVQMNNNNFLNLNIASLWENSQYAIVAVDCDGVSVTPEIIDRWPVVLITAPIDKNLGGTNPYAYKVPSRTDNPIRALVFDANAVSQVEYRVDGSGEWYPMSKVRLIGGSNSYLWEIKEWDTTSLDPLEDHTLEVRATGSTIRSDIITFEIFTTCTTPTQVGPSGSGHGVRPTYEWSSSGSWEWYWVYVTNKSTGAYYGSGWVNSSANTWTHPATSPALPWGTYQWWVRVYDSDCGYSEWAGPMDFSVGSCCTKPELNVDTSDVANPVFTWDCPTAQWQYAYVYLYNLSTGAVSGSGWLNGSQVTQWTPTGLWGSYRGWVRVWHSQCGYSEWSDPVDFTAGGSCCTKPTLTWNGTSFSWSCDGTDWQYAYVYLYSLSTGAVSGSGWLNGSQVTQWTPTGLWGSYRGWVRVWHSQCGYSEWSDPVDFTAGGSCCTKPTLTTPYGNQATYVWSCDTADWTWFWVYVYNLSTGAYYGSNWVNSSLNYWDQPSPLPAGNYRAWVRVWHPQCGYSEWSDPADWTVLAP